MEYFRQHVLLTSSPSPSVENFVSPSEHNASRPRLTKSNTHDADTREKDFVIPDLTKEPKNGVWWVGTGRAGERKEKEGERKEKGGWGRGRRREGGGEEGVGRREEGEGRRGKEREEKKGGGVFQQLVVSL